MDDSIFDNVILDQLHSFTKKQLFLINGERSCNLSIVDQNHLLKGNNNISDIVDRTFKEICHAIQLHPDQLGLVILFEHPVLEQKLLFHDPSNSIREKFDPITGVSKNSLHTSQVWTTANKWLFITSLMKKLETHTLDPADVTDEFLEMSKMFDYDDNAISEHIKNRSFSVVFHLFPYRFKIEYNQGKFSAGIVNDKTTSLGDTLQMFSEYTKSFLESQKHVSQHLTIEWNVSLGRRLVAFYLAIEVGRLWKTKYPRLSFNIQLRTKTMAGEDIYVFPSELINYMKYQKGMQTINNVDGTDVIILIYFLIYVFATSKYGYHKNLDPILKQIKESAHTKPYSFIKDLIQTGIESTLSEDPTVLSKPFSDTFSGDWWSFLSLINEKLLPTNRKAWSILNAEFASVLMLDTVSINDWGENKNILDLFIMHNVQKRLIKNEEFLKLEPEIRDLFKISKFSPPRDLLPKIAFYLSRLSPEVRGIPAYISNLESTTGRFYDMAIFGKSYLSDYYFIPPLVADKNNYGSYYGNFDNVFAYIQAQKKFSTINPTLLSEPVTALKIYTFNEDKEIGPALSVVKHHFPRALISNFERTPEKSFKLFSLVNTMILEIKSRIFYGFSLEEITTTLSLLLAFYDQKVPKDKIVEYAIQYFSLSVISNFFYLLKRLSMHPYYKSMFAPIPWMSILCFFLSELAGLEGQKTIKSLESFYLMPFIELLADPIEQAGKTPSPTKRTPTTTTTTRYSDKEIKEWKEGEMGQRKKEFKEYYIQLMEFGISKRGDTSMIKLVEKLRERIILVEKIIALSSSLPDKQLYESQTARLSKMKKLLNDLETFIKETKIELNRGEILLEKYPEIKKFQSPLLQESTPIKNLGSMTPPQTYKQDSRTTIQKSLIKFVERLKKLRGTITPEKLMEMFYMLVIVIQSETTAPETTAPISPRTLITDKGMLVGKIKDFSFTRGDSKEVYLTSQNEWLFHAGIRNDFYEDGSWLTDHMKNAHLYAESMAANAVEYIYEYLENNFIKFVSASSQKSVDTSFFPAPDIEKKKADTWLENDLLFMPTSFASFLNTPGFQEKILFYSEGKILSYSDLLKHIVFDKYFQYLRWQHYQLDKKHEAQYYNEELLLDTQSRCEIHYIPHKTRIGELVLDSERTKLFNEKEFSDEEELLENIRHWTKESEDTPMLSQKLQTRIETPNFYTDQDNNVPCVLEMTGISYLMAKNLFNDPTEMVVAVIFNLSQIPEAFDKSAFVSYLIANNYIIQNPGTTSPVKRPQDINLYFKRFPPEPILDGQIFLNLLNDNLVPLIHRQQNHLVKYVPSDRAPTIDTEQLESAHFILNEKKVTFNRYHYVEQFEKYAEHIWNTTTSNSSKIMLTIAKEHFFTWNLFAEDSQSKDLNESSIIKMTMWTLATLNKFAGLSRNIFASENSFRKNFVHTFLSFWLSPISLPRANFLVNWLPEKDKMIIKDDDLIVLISRVIHRHPSFDSNQVIRLNEIARAVSADAKLKIYKDLSLDIQSGFEEDIFLQEEVEQSIEDQEEEEEEVKWTTKTPFQKSIKTLIDGKFGRLKEVNDIKDLFVDMNMPLDIDTEEGTALVNLIGTRGDTDSIKNELLSFLNLPASKTVINFLREKCMINLRNIFALVNSPNSSGIWNKSEIYTELFQFCAYLFGCLQIKTQDKNWDFMDPNTWAQHKNIQLCYIKGIKESSRPPAVEMNVIYEIFLGVVEGSLLSTALLDLYSRDQSDFIDGQSIYQFFFNFFTQLKEDASLLVNTFSGSSKNLMIKLNLSEKEAKVRRLIQQDLLEKHHLSLVFLEPLNGHHKYFYNSSMERNKIDKLATNEDIKTIQKFLAAYLCIHRSYTGLRMPIVEKLEDLNELLSSDIGSLKDIQDIDGFFKHTFIEFTVDVIANSNIKFSDANNNIPKSIAEKMNLPTNFSLKQIIDAKGSDVKKEISVLLKMRLSQGGEKQGAAHYFYEPTTWHF